MAKNSLFAILLRSRWWISAVLALLIGTVSYALLPTSVRAVGVLSGLPFAVIAAVAARRQWGLPSPARTAATQQAVAAMPWPAFAALLEQAFQRQGYTVRRGTREPVDFELERQGRRTLVSARRWKSARIGLETLRALEQARDAPVKSALAAPELDAGPRPDALLIGLGVVSDTAQPYAAEHGIAVWQVPELARALQGLPLASGAAG